MVKMIFAVEAGTGLIGSNGVLPWRFKEDLAFFKDTTYHKIVFCGSSTFKYIPELPGRSIVVCSHDSKFREKTSKRVDFLVEDLDEFFKTRHFNSLDIFIVGGAKIYEQAAKYADELIVTSIKPPKGMNFEGDCYLFDYTKDFRFDETIKRVKCVNLASGPLKDVECELTMQRWVRKVPKDNPA